MSTTTNKSPRNVGAWPITQLAVSSRVPVASNYEGPANIIGVFGKATWEGIHS